MIMKLQRSSLAALLFTVCRTSAMLSPFSAAPGQMFARPAQVSASDVVPSSCSVLYDLFTSCATATPGFLTLEAMTQFSCLCYSSSTIVPTIFDNAFKTCVSYYETADPAVLTSAGLFQFFTKTVYGQLWTTPCAEFAAYQTVTSVTQDPRVSACSSLIAIVASCSQSTPGFTDLGQSSQASCQCYLSGGSTYAPQVYDGYLDTCLDWYSVHETQYYSSLGGDNILRTPCIEVGNVKSGVTATGTEASPSVPTQTSATATEALTTTQPKATATANQARGRSDSNDWSMLLGLFVLPLLLEIDLWN